MELKRLLRDPEMRHYVNDLDGDRSGILHGYAFNSHGDDPRGIVNVVLDAGRDANWHARSSALDGNLVRQG